MISLEIGQELEFIEPANTDAGVIAKGTRVRVGAIMAELVEPTVTLVVLGGTSPDTFTVPRHVVTLHCRQLQKPR